MIQESMAKHPEALPWKKIWGAGLSPWHRANAHTLLTKHFQLTNKGEGKKKWYIPMCGKSVEMKWLSERGHSVVGVEFEEIAVRSFFEEQELTYDILPCPQVQGKLYKSTQGDIRLYCCDVFKFNKDVESNFDAIWDRAAMEAIFVDQRPEYIELMQGMMAPSACVFLVTSNYDQSIFKGPPFVIPEHEIKHNFGDDYRVVQLDEMDASDVSPKALSDAGADLSDILYLIYRK